MTPYQGAESKAFLSSPLVKERCTAFDPRATPSISPAIISVGSRNFPRSAIFPHAAHHFRFQSFQDLRHRISGAQEHQPANPQGRDFRPAGSERRRQDDADRHHLRHRQSQPARVSVDGHDIIRGLPRRPLDDRPRAAGADDRRLRDRLGDGVLQPRPVRQAPRSRSHRKGAQGAVALGPQGLKAHDAVRRHEAPGADRQGVVARAANPLPRRADRRRRCRIAQGHVAGGALAARLGRHHHPDHPLYRGGRGHGRPHRRHQQGRNHSGRGQGRAHAQARQEAIAPAIVPAARRHSVRARRAPPGFGGRTAAS